jgi:hypothetical protein
MEGLWLVNYEGMEKQYLDMAQGGGVGDHFQHAHFVARGADAVSLRKGRKEGTKERWW